ncbi:DUF3298 domain-containing protein [Winogradskyella maritima]|uniref:DUF3298 domain-containing protein n=1 Tax=Winogradskyella maritima TaxID=1517766 RepID=A0ABV8AF33_9FLAO|nr:DUF3298 domain-containing protein [Winogradskyella maritima]
MLRKSALVLLLVFSFLSCKDEVKPLAFETTNIEGDFASEIEVSYALFSEGTASDAINITLSERIKEEIGQETSETVASAVKAFDDEYKAFKKDFPDSAQQWVLSIETEVLYQSEDILSLALSIYQDTGGAHGNDRINLLNFDPKTGKLLAYDDVFSDMDAMKTKVKSEFYKTVSDDDEDENHDYFFGKDFQLPENFGFTEDGVIFLYNTYEVASYDRGFVEFVVGYEEIEQYSIKN